MLRPRIARHHFVVFSTTFTSPPRLRETERNNGNKRIIVTK